MEIRINNETAVEIDTLIHIQVSANVTTPLCGEDGGVQTVVIDPSVATCIDCKYIAGAENHS